MVSRLGFIFGWRERGEGVIFIGGGVGCFRLGNSVVGIEPRLSGRGNRSFVEYKR